MSEGEREKERDTMTKTGESQRWANISRYVTRMVWTHAQTHTRTHTHTHTHTQTTTPMHISSITKKHKLELKWRWIHKSHRRRNLCCGHLKPLSRAALNTNTCGGTADWPARSPPPPSLPLSPLALPLSPQWLRNERHFRGAAAPGSLNSL